MPNPKLVSVLIRNRNESASLELVLKALAAQADLPFQIVVVDNESTDGSRDTARAHGAEIIHLPRADFTYGRALNLGIRACRGELVLILSAHSLPLSRHFLTDIQAPFLDENVAAARCLHIGKSKEVRTWMEVRTLTGDHSVEEVIAKGPLASGCVIRRSVWETVPFDETVEAVEDKFWALEVLKKGYVIRNCEAMYYYLRLKSRREELQTASREAVALYKHSGIAPRMSFGTLCRDVFLGAPRAAVNVVSAAVLRYMHVKSTRRRAKGSPRIGAIR